MNVDLTRQLRLDEGERATVYPDSLGFWTIGVGRLVDPRKAGAGLRPSEISFLLANDIDDRTAWLSAALPWTETLDVARRGALLNMSFQLGKEGLLGFKNTLRLIQAGRYEDAARAMLESRWALQTPERAHRLSEQMRTGEWKFAS